MSKLDDLLLARMTPEELLADISTQIAKHTQKEPYSKNTVWYVHDKLHRYMELTSFEPKMIPTTLPKGQQRNSGKPGDAS